MPEYNLPLSQPDLVDFTDQEGPIQTTNVAGAAVSAYESLFSLPNSFIANRAKDALIKEFAPGKFLTAKEYDNSPLKIPGLSFPNGVSTNVLKARHSRWVDSRFREDALNNMAPGFLSFASRQVGTTVGMLSFGAFDAAELGLAKATTSLTGRLMPWILDKMENTGAQLATKFVGGAVEGAVIGAPISYAQYKNQQDIGEDPGVLSALINDGLGAGIGGFLRTGIGWNRPMINAQDHNMAKETAISHVLDGKPAYIEPIIKNATYQMSRESEPFIQRAEKMVQDIQPELEKTESELTAKKSELKDTFEKRKVGTNLVEEEKGSEFIKRLQEMRDKPDEFHTEEDQKLLKRFSTPTMRAKEATILQKAHDISEKPLIKRTEEETSFLNDVVGTKEKERTIAEIDDLKQKQDGLKSELEDTKAPSKKTKLRFKISDFNDRIEKNQTRLDNLRALDKLEKDDVETFKKRSDIKKLETKRDVLKSTSDANRIYAQSMNMSRSPLAESDLRTNTAWINDWRSDFAYSDPEMKAYEAEVSGISDDVDLDMAAELDTVNGMRERGELSPEQEEFVDNFKKEDAAFNKIAGAIREYYQCAIREGE